MTVTIKDGSKDGLKLDLPDNVTSVEFKVPLQNGCFTTERYEIRMMPDGNFVGELI